jgi:hypothetical protein
VHAVAVNSNGIYLTGKRVGRKAVNKDEQEDVFHIL